ncbi:MAG: Cof-type HAD-IIB family hydrolase [Bacillaceae bacterium]
MIKLIATDMDGTFLNDKNQFPINFEEIFAQLKEKNILFSAASGRQYYNLEKRFEAYKNDMLFIAENGTYVMYKGKELFSNTVDHKVAMELIDVARTIDGVAIVICGKKAAYIETDDKKVLEEVDKYYARREIVDDVKKIEDDILKVTLLDFQGAEHHSMPYFEMYKESLQVTVGGYIWLDIMNGGANKGVAIQKVQQLLNISYDETMVFGDYLNDLEMMENAYHSYAMVNAHEQLKQAARFETALTNNENGVMATIQEKVLICA